MYVMIDNFDSFVYNLKAYFEQLGRDITVRRCDDITIKEIKDMKPEGIILSPGPKRPSDAQMCMQAVKEFAGIVPILGVCLGHQVIGYCAGATVEKGRKPMHGKVTKIENNSMGLFYGLPKQFYVTRYHSLVIKKGTLCDDYRIDAVSEDGEMMGISHKTQPIYGVQFHPEAVMTQYGHEILENFCIIAERFNALHRLDALKEQKR